MTKSKKNHDTISEEEFTAQERGASTNPQDDSPGDSEKDADTEFLMGMGYQPIATELADEEETLQNKDSTLERPNNLVLTPQEPHFRIPTSVMIKSSGQPAPRQDQDKSTSDN